MLIGVYELDFFDAVSNDIFLLYRRQFVEDLLDDALMRGPRTGDVQILRINDFASAQLLIADDGSDIATATPYRNRDSIGAGHGIFVGDRRKLLGIDVDVGIFVPQSDEHHLLAVYVLLQTVEIVDQVLFGFFQSLAGLHRFRNIAEKTAFLLR